MCLFQFFMIVYDKLVFFCQSQVFLLVCVYKCVGLHIQDSFKCIPWVEKQWIACESVEPTKQDETETK